MDGKDIPDGDEGIGGVEQAEEAGVVEDFISDEHVRVVGIGRDAREQCTEDKGRDTNWNGSAREGRGEKKGRTCAEQGENDVDIDGTSDGPREEEGEQGDVEDGEHDCGGECVDAELTCG